MALMYRYRTVFSGSGGAPWLSTFWFDSLGGTAQQAATAAGLFWTTVQARMSTDVTWSGEPLVTSIDPATGQPNQITTVTPVTGAGSSAADPLPAICQGNLSWHTGQFLNGREVTGRTFLPGLSEDSSDTNGQVAAAAITVFNTAASALISSANAQLVVYSRRNLGMTVVGGHGVNFKFAILASRRD